MDDLNPEYFCWKYKEIPVELEGSSHCHPWFELWWNMGIKFLNHVNINGKLDNLLVGHLWSWNISIIKMEI